MIVLAAAGEPFWMNPTFWVGVAFFILLAMAVRSGVIGTVTKALDDRAAGIAKELDEARRLREDAAKLLADYQKKRADAEAEANAILDQARRDAEVFAAETRRTLRETLERRTKQAEEKIARAEAQAVSEVRGIAVDRAIATAGKLLADRATSATAAALIDDSIKGLKGKLN
jgi:F-type H+-transporting ATPase subunit b